MPLVRSYYEHVPGHPHLLEHDRRRRHRLLRRRAVRAEPTQEPLRAAARQEEELRGDARDGQDGGERDAHRGGGEELSRERVSEGGKDSEEQKRNCSERSNSDKESNNNSCKMSRDYSCSVLSPWFSLLKCSQNCPILIQTECYGAQAHTLTHTHTPHKNNMHHEANHRNELVKK